MHDSVEYLLKIVNAKLNWDRREGLIGTNITKIVDTSMDVFDDQETTQQIGFDDMEDDSRIMPPPPRLSPEKVDPVYPQDKVKSMMPPPIKVDTEPLSKKQRVIGILSLTMINLFQTVQLSHKERKYNWDLSRAHSQFCSELLPNQKRQITPIPQSLPLMETMQIHHNW
jgi:hypothetical protein